MNNTQEDMLIAMVDHKWKGRPRKHRKLSRHLGCTDNYCWFYGKTGGIELCKRKESEEERLYMVREDKSE